MERAPEFAAWRNLTHLQTRGTCLRLGGRWAPDSGKDTACTGGGNSPSHCRTCPAGAVGKRCVIKPLLGSSCGARRPSWTLKSAGSSQRCGPDCLQSALSLRDSVHRFRLGLTSCLYLMHFRVALAGGRNLIGGCPSKRTLHVCVHVWTCNCALRHTWGLEFRWQGMMLQLHHGYSTDCHEINNSCL